MKILFVENHAIFAEVVRKEFLASYCVTIVPSIQAAKEKIQTENFPFILVDYDLNDGKGTEFVRILKQKNYCGKIIAVSSHEQGNDLLMEMGADAVCGKMEFSKIGEVLDYLKKQIDK